MNLIDRENCEICKQKEWHIHIRKIFMPFGLWKRTLKNGEKE